MNTSFEEKVLCEISGLSDKVIILAFSGGRDSRALFHFLNRYKKRIPFRFFACHINHMLRSDSDNDEKFVKEICESSGIKVFVEKKDIYKRAKEKGTSLEHEARNFRLAVFKKLIKNLGADYIVTAHHQDDLLENFFLKSFQGSSLYNLKGFNYSDNLFFRPMLNVSAEEINEYVAKYRLNYVTDATNFDSNFPRNWIRHEIIPVIRNYNQGYLHNLIKLQDDSDELFHYLSRRIREINIEKKGNMFKLSASEFLSLDRFEQKFLVSSIISKFCRPEKRLIENILEISYKRESKRINLPNDFLFEKSCKSIRFYPKSLIAGYEYVKKPTEKVVILSNLGKIITFDKSLEKCRLIIRNRHKGDRLGSKKLKDLFIDKHIDLFLRDTAVVVEKDGQIVFAEGVVDNDNVYIRNNTEEA